MKILIAEDDADAIEFLTVLFGQSGYEVKTAKNGDEAWAMLQAEDAPPLVILDVMMPGTDGVELCRRIRHEPRLKSTYIIMHTARTLHDDLLLGLGAGADDYIFKPSDIEELRARVRIGERVVELQKSLVDRVRELETALSQVRQLQGILPLCAYCKKIRNDENYWQRVEQYISQHTDAQISHGICPDCYATEVQPQLDKLKH